MQSNKSVWRLAAVALCAGAVSLASMSALAEVRVVKKVEPEFPREAERAGVDQGLVKARMTLDASGEVVRVEVIDAKPARYFDRAVVRTLSQWKFDAGSDKRMVDIDVEFKR